MRIAIVGCGQLARMLAGAAERLGMRCSFLARPEEDAAPVSGLGPIIRQVCGTSTADLYEALGEPQVITYENEHVDTALLQRLAAHCPVYPEPGTLATVQHRLQQKQLVARLGLATAPFCGARNRAELEAAVASLGLPVMIKSCRNGYDGRGQWRITNRAALHAFCEAHSEGDWLVERLVSFEREVSLLAARSRDGAVAFYPLTENRHIDGILLASVAPATGLPPAWEQTAREGLARLLEDQDYVGVIAMECFVVAGELLVNELAPRVHNSGHWTLHSEATSQFENHLRAIAGRPLGDTAIRRCEGMVNVLGERWTADPGLTYIDYNKRPAPRRKLGHIHLHSTDLPALEQQLGRVVRELYPQGLEAAP